MSILIHKINDYVRRITSLIVSNVNRIILILAILNTAVISIDGTKFKFNSDMLEQYVFGHFLVSGNSIWDWHFGASLTILRKLVFAISYYLFEDVVLVHAFIYFLYSWCFLVILFKTYRLFLSKEIAFSYLVITFLIVQVISTTWVFKPFSSHFLFSSFHHAPYLIGMVMIYVVLKSFDGIRRPLLYFSTLLLVALTSVSDKIFIPHVVGPVVFALAVLWILRVIDNKKGLYYLYGLVAWIISHLVLQYWINANTKYTDEKIDRFRLGISAAADRLSLLKIELIEMWESQPESFILVLIFYLFILFLGSLRFSQLKENRVLFFLFLFHLAIVPATFLPLIFGNTSVADRYFWGVFKYPIIYLPSVVAFIGTTLSSNSALSKVVTSQTASRSLLLLGLLLETTFLSYVVKFPLLGNTTPNSLQCFEEIVDRHQLTAGLAGPWEAKFYESFSNFKVPMANLSKDYRVRTKLDAGNDFNMKEGYDFVLERPEKAIDTAKFFSYYGRPDYYYQCLNKYAGEAYLNFYVYNKPIRIYRDSWNGNALFNDQTDMKDSCVYFNREVKITDFAGARAYLEPGYYTFNLEYTFNSPPVTASKIELWQIRNAPIKFKVADQLLNPEISLISVPFEVLIADEYDFKLKNVPQGMTICDVSYSQDN